MPHGVVQWFDAAAGEAAVVKAGRVFRAAAGELEAEARHPGARVHFDIRRDHGVDRAVRVTLRPGTRVGHGQHRFGGLTGARRVDTKGAAPFAHPHPELGLSLASHPLEVARAWARCLEASRLDVALGLYAPDAVLHVGGEPVSGRAHLQSYLEASPLLGIEREPVIRGEDGMVLLRWEDTDGAPPSIEVRCRIAHGQLAEQWIGEAPPEGGIVTVRATGGPLAMTIVTRGDVSADARTYAAQRLGDLIERIEEPVLFARVKLTQAPDPARDRPALAQVSVDVNGELVRAQVSGHAMREAIDLVQARLRDKLEHRAEHREARRQRPGTRESGEWRHGDPPTARPDYYDRPVDERELVRHKTYLVDELTPDEAAFDMEQLDFDFYLFRDLATGDDALLERQDDGSYRLTRLHPAPIDPGPTAVTLAVVEHPAPELSWGEAVERLAAEGERFVFFANATTGRGNVIYHRYDGHYGLIAPE